MRIKINNKCGLYFGLISALMLLGGCSDQFSNSSSEPISREAALKHNLGIPLPPSASKVQFQLKTGGLQAMDFFLRFSVSPNEADAAVQAIIDDNNMRMNRNLLFQKTVLPIESGEIEEDQVEPRSVVLDIPAWWEVDAIKRGYFRVEEEGYAPAIWYDADNSIIFFRQCD